MKGNTSLLLALLPGMLLAQGTYVVTPVQLTPAGKDFAPVLVDSTVVMCSLRERGELLDYRDAVTGNPLGDLYSFRWSNGKATDLGLFPGQLNTKVNDGPASFTADGATICFTRDQGDPNRPTKAGLPGLFFSSRTADGWGPVTPFPYNSNKHVMVHGALSPNGLRLVFASDMPGGAGGTDLYLCEKDGDGWSEPTPLTALNSAANEAFPSFGSDGAMYFSSAREGGHGKMDIYRAPKRGLKWAAPEALPAPLNSAGNDVGHTTFPNGRSGFISSDRSGQETILAFEHILEPFTNCTEEPPDNLCYRFQTPAGASLPGLPILSRWDLGDGTVVEGHVVEHCYATPGDYTVVLDLIEEPNGTIFLKGEPRTVRAARREQLRIGIPATVNHGRAVELEAQRTDLKGFTPERCTWDLGDGTSRIGNRLQHEWSAPGTYTVRLDVQGMDALSGRMRSYCVTRKLEVYKRGETPPASTITPGNSFVYQELPADHFGLSFLVGDDTDFMVELFASKERVGLNDARFVEVRKFYPVYERYDPKRGMFSYTVGQGGDLASAYEVYKKMKELRFMEAEVIVLRNEKVADLSSLEMFSVEELVNTVIRSSTVRFDNGSWAIHRSFLPQLDKVRKLLEKYPELDIAIEAHTDDVGADDFNLELSQKRAQSIVDHLVQGGITAERLKPIGQGENHPIADNSKSAGRALNRRVEFRLSAREEQQASQHRD